MKESKIKDISFLVLYLWKGESNVLYHCQVSAPTRDHAKRRFLSSVKFSQLGKTPARSVVIRQIIAPGEPIYVPMP